MPVGKGSLQRAAGAKKNPKTAAETTVKKPVKTDPAKLAARPAGEKTAAKKAKAAPAPAPEAAPAAEVTAAVIPSASPEVVSHLICELPVYLL